MEKELAKEVADELIYIGKQRANVELLPGQRLKRGSWEILEEKGLLNIGGMLNEFVKITKKESTLQRRERDFIKLIVTKSVLKIKK
jgi:hypothetical protein